MTPAAKATALAVDARLAALGPDDTMPDAAVVAMLRAEADARGVDPAERDAMASALEVALQAERTRLAEHIVATLAELAGRSAEPPKQLDLFGRGAA